MGWTCRELTVANDNVQGGASCGQENCVANAVAQPSIDTTFGGGSNISAGAAPGRENIVAAEDPPNPETFAD